jgi:hypothetical protein
MLRPQTKTALESFVAGGAGGGYFNVEVYLNDRIHADINVDVDRDWDDDDYFQRDADSGDVYRTPKSLEVKINWPGYGAMRASEALPVLAFWQRVAMFGAQLELAIAGRYADLHKTKQQEEADEANRTKKLQQDIAEKVIGEHCKAMRVDKERHVPSADVEGLPDGTYVRDLNEKSFELRISRDIGLSFIIRVK